MAWVYDDTRNQNRYAWTWNSPQAINNYWQMYHYFVDSNKMTVQALCGILGNIACESFGNPLQEQKYDSTPLPPVNDRGLGLIQWTPQSSLKGSVSNWENGDSQCLLIWNEITGVVSGRFYPSVSHPEYSYSGAEFCALTSEVEAARAYFYERERGTWTTQRETRATWILTEVFGGQPEPPTPPSPEDDDFIVWILKLLKLFN